MNFLRISSLFLCLILLGCNPKIMYQTEFIEVKVPIIYKLDRPPRPVMTKKESIPVYLNRLLKYTKELEVIIDTHNEGAT